MPSITEAHVVLIKKPFESEQDEACVAMATPWEEYLEKNNRIKPQRFQVHLVVSGFSEREEARGFAENFMSYGSMFVFNNKKRPLYRIDVDSDDKGCI